MARPKQGDKPRDIRHATVTEVVRAGSTAVSVNKIAERAGVSVGTLYRYHDTKDDLLFAVFLEIKRELHAAMMMAANVHAASASRLRAMWFALVGYGCTSPDEFLFAEIMGSDIRTADRRHEELDRIGDEILLQIENAIEDGTLVNASVAAIEVMLSAPAMKIARRSFFAGKQPEDAFLEEIFALIWQSIANRDGYRA